ncbi:hypothetical protein [Enteractinococcus helveticum]|uniref:Fe-S protein n=1 Tax=Enteractinococcus helveticum TaxID=1837282 RepID=A0A1B7LZE7_9MICC|nr:hypothetical protein [Enteractinococcus helveticum]OAV60866.1 hypothetical protein A6F49_10280 [Enteractinococcus helveticum]
MEIVQTIFIAIHILSMAAIVGGWLANFKNPTVTKSQWYGAIFMIISGVVLFGLTEMMGDPDGALRIKLTIKLILGVMVFVTALLGRRKINRGEEISTGLAHATGGTAVIAALVATLWRF